MARTGAEHFLERAWLALRLRCAWFFFFSARNVPTCSYRALPYVCSTTVQTLRPVLAGGVVRLDGALEVGSGHTDVRIELRRVQHLLSVLADRHPLFAHVATNLFNRDQNVLLAYYPQQAPGAHHQEARLASFPVDVEVLHSSYLLVCNVINVKPPDVLPVLF